MGYPRNRPKILPTKLRAIRDFLNFTQVQMAKKLQSEIRSRSGRKAGTLGKSYEIKPTHISEYERGKRETDFFVLLAYVRLGRVGMEYAVDDAFTVNTFRKWLGKEPFNVSRSTKHTTKKPVGLNSRKRK